MSLAKSPVGRSVWFVVVIHIGVQDPGPSETTRTYPQNYYGGKVILASLLLLLFIKFRSKPSVYLLVIKNNITQVRHITCEDSVTSRVVAVFVTGESLRKSSDILDTCGNNHQENQTTGPHLDRVLIQNRKICIIINSLLSLSFQLLRQWKARSFILKIYRKIYKFRRRKIKAREGNLDYKIYIYRTRLALAHIDIEIW